VKLIDIMNTVNDDYHQIRVINNKYLYWSGMRYEWRGQGAEDRVLNVSAIDCVLWIVIKEEELI